MAIKPTAGDVGTLAVMGAVLVLGAAYTVVRARSIEAPAPARADAGA
jgi:hypothetical protein